MKTKMSRMALVESEANDGMLIGDRGISPVEARQRESEGQRAYRTENSAKQEG